jgi:hypothetical protein|tara:strand:- start:13074 stop:13499 length:426 start_codon:yes stop_codon:yes gene_type:complete
MFPFHSLRLLSQKPEQAPKPEQKKLVSVQFAQMPQVKIIQNRETLKEEGLIAEIWFQPDEYAKIKEEAKEQVLNFAYKKGITPKKAMHQLFQPHALDASSEEDSEDSSEEYDSEEYSSEGYDSEECTPDVHNPYDALRMGA